MVSDMTQQESTIDVTAFTEHELYFYRSLLGDAMQMHKRIQKAAEASASTTMIR